MKTQTCTLVIALIGIATLLSVNVTFAQKEKRIRFAKGSNSGIVKGVISKPNSGETYLIGAKAGQKMLLEFDAIGSAMPVIMVYPPGKTSEDSKILDEGSGGEYEVDVKTAGDYSLFIGCGRKCTYTLKVTIEASFKRGKGEAGMDEYQVRTWEGWHHHMALTLIAV